MSPLSRFVIVLAIIAGLALLFALFVIRNMFIPTRGKRIDRLTGATGLPLSRMPLCPEGIWTEY